MSTVATRRKDPPGWPGAWWARLRAQDAPVVPVLGLLALITIWHLAVELLDIRSYLLPAPLDVIASLWRGLTAPFDSRLSFFYHLSLTLQAAGLGLLLGSVLGVLMAALAASNRLIDSILSPYVFALQGLPKIALAPMIMIWFGFGLTSKTLLAAFLVFFPMFVNAYAGLTTVSQEYERLFRSLGASKLQTLMQLRLPSALVLIFAGLEIGVVQALIGAIVGEFVSANAGMGILLKQYQTLNNTAAMFAALIVLGLAGIGFHACVRYARARVVFWSQEREGPREEVGD